MALAEMLETIIVGVQAHRARKESEKRSSRVLESKKFQKAKKEGKVGRKKKDVDVQEIVRLRNKGWSFEKIAEKLKVPKTTIHRRSKNVVENSEFLSGE